MSRYTRIKLFADTLKIGIDDIGSGKPFILLHGGAGPASMSGLATRLFQGGYRAIVPVYPGFDNEPRPSWLDSVDYLSLMVLALIEKMQLHSVTLIGNSVGGWVALEAGLKASPYVRDVVIMDAAGLGPSEEGGSVIDPMGVPMPQLLAMSYHDPSAARLPKHAAAAENMAKNQATLRIYAGDPFMHHPTLRPRLRSFKIPCLILWGESDQITSLKYGKQFSKLIPHATFETIPKAGHFPQIEQIDLVMKAIQRHAGQ